MSERIINAERIEQIINVFGSFDENIKRIEQTYGVKITNRGTELKISARTRRRTAQAAPSRACSCWPQRARRSTSRRCAI